MNRIFKYLILINCLFFETVSAQYTVTLNISYPAPTYLSDWNNSRAGLMTVIFKLDEDLAGTVKFRTQLENSDGGIIAKSSDASAIVYTLRNGANTFTLDKVLQYENLQFLDGDVIRNIQTSGKLPAGNYQLCIQLLNSSNHTELLKIPVCRPFYQANYQLPYLLAPNDKTWLDANIAQSIITFRWSSVVPQIMESIIYRLQVFEVLENQQPLQALRSNQPILNAEIRNITQYIWRPQLSFKDSTAHVFIWTIQTLDSKGFPITSTDEYNQGRSEPRVFGVCNKTGQNMEDPGNDCATGRKL